MPLRPGIVVVVALVFAGCAPRGATSRGLHDLGGPATSSDGASGGGGARGDGSDGGGSAGSGGGGAGGSLDGGGPSPSCTTRITYGNTWLHPANHPDQFDVVAQAITWDGSCTDDGANSFAVLSNGWKPVFAGNGACVIALDYDGSCGAPASCASRARYGDAWRPAPMHPDHWDDVGGRLFSGGACIDSGNDSYTTLSNGWQPWFSGHGACSVAFRYEQCGGLYANPVIGFDCPDPGVLRDGSRYILACTSGNAADAYPMFTSTDLTQWTAIGHIFPSAKKPAWASGDFWAPEIHKIGNGWVAYFTARDAKSGRLAIGAATATSPIGPFSDTGKPLVLDGSVGMIDPTEIDDAGGAHFLVWKQDTAPSTPIFGQPLAADGVTLTGQRTQLIINDQKWEGSLVEGPWVFAHGGSFYLFYSANPYYTADYAVGVARAAAPLGPYTKAAGPVVAAAGAWAGPGHCSVVDGPGGETYMIYHAWQAAHVNAAPGRLVLTDEIVWQNGWPAMPGAPSSASRPLP